jgi:hypothetical protein
MSRQSSPALLHNEIATINDRLVTLTAGNQTLTIEDHANRLLVVSSELTDASQTKTLPKTTGSGDVYEIVNNAVLTQSLVVAALGADVLSGSAFLLSETTTNTDVFHTTATSDKYTFNVTTMGGLRGDRIKLVDIAAGTWLVQVLGNGSGTMLTGFSAT